VRVKGKAVRGIGKSREFLSIDWVNRQLRDKLDFLPYQGTFNIVLDNAETQRILKEKGRDRLAHETEGFCDALVFRGAINGDCECGVVLPLVPDYDECLLEIVAPVNLRESLCLADDDEVNLDIFI
jgi:riboflavin kinase, archaea type